MNSLNSQWVQVLSDKKYNYMYGTWDERLKISSLALSGTKVYAGCDLGLYVSTNQGTNWTLTNSNKVNSLASNDSIMVWGGNGVNISQDSGKTWGNVFSGMGYTFDNIPVVAINNKYVFAVDYMRFPNTTYGNVLRSNYPGNGSWNLFANGLKTSTIYSLLTLGMDLFAGTNDGVYFSNDSAQSWIRVGFAGVNVYSIVANNSYIFAGTDGGVFRSNDNGSNWVAAGLINTKVISFATSGKSLFAGSEGCVFASIDNGTNWTAVNTGLPYTFVRALTIVNNYLLAGTDGSASGLGIGGVWKRPVSEMIFSKLSQSRTIVDIGNVKLGLSKRDTLTIRNTGTDTLKISSITATNPVWSVSQTVLTIPPNQSIIDTLIFIPNVFGIASGKIIFISNGSSSPDTIIVTGNSPAPISRQVPSQYSTIQAALNAAQAGDTVLVQPGTYKENLVWPNVNGIKLISAGDSSNTIIDGDKKSSVIVINSLNVIDSNTIIQ
jgi:photosystem II stability/assembly factor-like uncharacterized protein